jgi:hypothetical protein
MTTATLARLARLDARYSEVYFKADERTAYVCTVSTTDETGRRVPRSPERVIATYRYNMRTVSETGAVTDPTDVDVFEALAFAQAYLYAARASELSMYLYGAGRPQAKSWKRADYRAIKAAVDYLRADLDAERKRLRREADRIWTALKKASA